MRKMLVGVVLVGAVIAMLPLLRRLGDKMREHCEQMARHCRDLAATGGRQKEAERAGAAREEVGSSDRRIEASLR